MLDMAKRGSEGSTGDDPTHLERPAQEVTMKRPVKDKKRLPHKQPRQTITEGFNNKGFGRGIGDKTPKYGHEGHT
jgi:hypothetical protein